MAPANDVLDFVLEATGRGERVALVTLTAVTGSSARDPGTQMAVSETGAYVGSVSSGCFEAAVVAEARRVLGRGKAKLVRFGAGSDYLDIRLPCGGGIDMLFTPDPDRSVINIARRRLSCREPTAIRLGRDGSVRSEPVAIATGWDGDEFVVSYRPRLRILGLGHGAEMLSLAMQARAYGAGLTVLTPDEALVDRLAASGVEARHLLTPAPSPDVVADPHTAILFLFHDHDWETALLAQALETPAFFVGAMGSSRTHERRCRDLLSAGVDESAVARVRSPLGLIPAARDPDTLALSALAQVVAEYRRSAPVASARRIQASRHATQA